MKIDKNTFENHVQFCEPGRVIFKENEAGEIMFVIIQGAVEIRKSTGPSSSKVLTTLQKGDIFGEMAIIEKMPRSASAVAVEPTKLLAINQNLYDTMIGSNADFARKMNRLLSERLRKTNAIIQQLMSTNRQNQLWSGLVEYSRDNGVSTFKGSRVSVADFKSWAASHIGMSEKEVETLLALFIKRGIVAFSAKSKEEILVTPKSDATLPEAPA